LLNYTIPTIHTISSVPTVPDIPKVNNYDNIYLSLWKYNTKEPIQLTEQEAKEHCSIIWTKTIYSLEDIKFEDIFAKADIQNQKKLY
jgi:hypothetical protein